MKNLILTILVTSLMIACGDSKGNKGKTVAQAGHGAHGARNTHGVCNEILPFALAQQYGYIQSGNRNRNGHQNRQRNNGFQNQRGNNYRADNLRFYSSGGDFFLYRGNNRYIHEDGGSVTCERLTAIDRHYDVSPTCWQYQYNQNGFARNTRNGHRYQAQYNRAANPAHATFSIAVNNTFLNCPASSYYYDFFFMTFNNGQINHHLGFGQNNAGSYGHGRLSNYYGFQIGAGFNLNFSFGLY